ncbi:TPA: hypothetical protein IVM20_001887 [Enterococcus faecium]|nr:hypothetical protein [Enterococcus faecium]
MVTLFYRRDFLFSIYTKYFTLSEKVKEVKILHNAGVTTNDEDLFFKGRYVTSTPFDEDLSFVNKKKCSYAYVKAIKAVVR